MWKKILIATDLSPTSMPALARGLELASQQRAVAIVLTVDEKHHPTDHWAVPLFEEELAMQRSLRKREEEALRQLARRNIDDALAGIADKPRVDVLVRGGRAAAAIIGTAEEVGANLIVVGSRGRRGSIGSVAERVVRDAHRPVLVIPTELAP